MSCCVLLLLLSLSTSLTVLVSSKSGFSVDLIHVDSAKSPFYDPNLTKSERFHLSLNRSINRAKYPSNANANGFQSPITTTMGGYLMSMNLGTPPLNAMVFVDTGSDLLWTQCKPCQYCYPQKAPIFDSSKSSTYKALPYESKSCSVLEGRKRGAKSVCGYKFSYGDRIGSSTEGVLSTETFTFDSSNARTALIHNMIFGCSQNNVGNFEQSMAGIAGLNRGPLSLVSQLGPIIDYKFSYCLVETDFIDVRGGLLNFGDKANVGPGALVTPIFMNKGRRFFPSVKNSHHFYWLRLESIIVGNEIIPLKKTKQDEGNIIVDSGTTFTKLDDATLKPLVDKLSKLVKYPVAPKPRSHYKLCYNIKDVGDRWKNELPPITFQFTGAKVILKPFNTFGFVGDNVICLTIVSRDNFAQILGNVAQQNMHVGFDLKNNKLSIAPTDCSKM